MMRSKLTLPVLFTSFALHGHANAIVNVEDLHTGSPKEGFSGNVLLSMAKYSGNVEKQDYSLGSRLQWHQNASTNYLILSGDYGEVETVKNTEKTFIHARHIQQFRPTIAAEAYIQQETNKFSRIDYRRLLGAGMRFTLFEEDNTGNAYLGLGAFYSTQKISSGEVDSGTDDQRRASSYLLLKYQATDNTVLASTTYYQPVLGDAGDFRALQEAAMRVRLSTRLSLVLSANIRYDSRPPVGVDKQDSTYKTALSVEF